MRVLLISLALMFTGPQSSQRFSLEHTAASPRDAQIAGLGDRVFYATRGLSREELVIGHVGNTVLPQWNPFQGSQERHRIRDIAVNGAGDLFVAYSSRTGGWGEVRFASVEYGSSISDLWASDDLAVESFSVSDHGAFYVLGIPLEIYLELARPGGSRGRRVATLVHIYDDKFHWVRSLLPTELSSSNVELVSKLLRESRITVRPNGNFFVIAHPLIGQMVAGGELLTNSQEIVEYDPAGGVANVHSIPGETSSTPVSGVFPDREGGLVVQLAGFERRSAKMFAILPSTVVSISNGSKVQLDQLERGEWLISVEQGGSGWTTFKDAGGPRTIHKYARERRLETRRKP